MKRRDAVYGAILVLAIGGFAVSRFTAKDDGPKPEQPLTAAEQPYVTALGDHLASGGSPLPQLDLTPTQGRCAARHWVARMGPDELRDEQLDPAEVGKGRLTVNLDLADGKAMIGDLRRCHVDVDSKIRAGLRSSLAERGADRKVQDCAADGLTRSLIDKSLALVLIADGPRSDLTLQQQLTDVAASCSPGG